MADDDRSLPPLLDYPVRPLVAIGLAILAVAHAAVGAWVLAAGFGLGAGSLGGLSALDLVGVEPPPILPLSLALAFVAAAVLAFRRGSEFATGLFVGLAIGLVYETARLFRA